MKFSTVNKEVRIDSVDPVCSRGEQVNNFKSFWFSGYKGKGAVVSCR
jgi:hypothetical protein